MFAVHCNRVFAVAWSFTVLTMFLTVTLQHLAMFQPIKASSLSLANFPLFLIGLLLASLHASNVQPIKAHSLPHTNFPLF